MAENRRINQDLLIPEDERGGAKAGDVVVAEIVEQPSPQREAIARIVEVQTVSATGRQLFLYERA